MAAVGGKTKEPGMVHLGAKPLPKPAIAAPGDPPTRGRNRKTLIEADGVEIRRITIPLWEDKWPEARLREKYRTMGPREFDRSYRQLAISDEDLLWGEEWVERALDHTTTLPESLSGGWEKLHRFAGVDLAIATAEREGAYFVLCAIALDARMHRWVIGLERHRGMSFAQQCELVNSWHLRFHFNRVAVESNAYQMAMVQTLREASVPVLGIHTGSIQKTDLEVGIPSMAAEWEQGLWHVPFGDARSRRLVEPLLEELYAYPTPGHYTDCVMALYFARESFRTLAQPEARLYCLSV